MNSLLRLTISYGLHVMLLIGILIAGQACEFSTANIERAVMARAVNEQSEPLEETSSFYGSESLLHCSVLMANTPEGTAVKAVWYHDGKDTKTALDSTTITMDGDGWIDFTLSLTSTMLPYGSYSVDLYIGDKYARTVPFTVEPMYPDSYVKEAVIASKVSDSYFPVDRTWVFPEGTKEVFAPIYVSGQPAGTVFASQWYAHDESGDRTPISFYEIPFDETGWILFTLNLPDGLRAGRYSVDILIDGEVEHTLEFRAE